MAARALFSSRLYPALFLALVLVVVPLVTAQNNAKLPWVNRYDDATRSMALSVQVDPATQEIYASTPFQGTLNLAGGQSLSAQYYMGLPTWDALLVKYKPDGVTPLWTFWVSGAQSDPPKDVRFIPGFVYLMVSMNNLGLVQTTVSVQTTGFAPTTIDITNIPACSVLFKLSSVNGTVLWYRLFAFNVAPAANPMSHALAVDKNGNAAIGWTQLETDTTQIRLNSATGTLIWDATLGPAYPIGSSGLYIEGSDCALSYITAFGVHVYTAHGGVRWYGNNPVPPLNRGNNVINGVAFDGTGSTIFWAGFCGGLYPFRWGTYIVSAPTGSGGGDMLMLSLIAATGEQQWMKATGGPNMDNILDIDYHSGTNMLWAVGSFKNWALIPYGNAYYAPGGATANGLVVFKIDPSTGNPVVGSANVVLAGSTDTTFGDEVWSIDVDPPATSPFGVYVTGSVVGVNPVVFGDAAHGGTITKPKLRNVAGAHDGFLWKLNVGLGGSPITSSYVLMLGGTDGYDRIFDAAGNGFGDAVVGMTCSSSNCTIDGLSYGANPTPGPHSELGGGEQAILFRYNDVADQCTGNYGLCAPIGRLQCASAGAACGNCIGGNFGVSGPSNVPCCTVNCVTINRQGCSEAYQLSVCGACYVGYVASGGTNSVCNPGTEITGVSPSTLVRGAVTQITLSGAGLVDGDVAEFTTGIICPDTLSLVVTGGQITYTATQPIPSTLRLCYRGVVTGGVTKFQSLVSFAVSFGALTQLVLTSPVSTPLSVTAALPFPAQPVYTLQDAYGNTVTSAGPGVRVTLPAGVAATLTGATVLAAVNGVVTFTNLAIDKVGTWALNASVTTMFSVVRLTNVVVNVGAGYRLVYRTAAVGSSGGAPFATQPVVGVQDVAFNDLSAGTFNVTLSVTPASGRLYGSALWAETVGGQAVFNGVAIDKAGTFTLTASSPGLLAVGSSVTIIVGPPVKLSVSTPPSAATGGVAFGVQPVVQVWDAGNNLVTTAAGTVNIAVTLAPMGASALYGGGGLSANVVSGVATFTGLTLDKAGGYELTVSSGILPTATTPLTVTVGPAARAVYYTPPSGFAIAQTFATQPTVAITDMGGNIVAAGSFTVQLTLTGSAGGVLGGGATSGTTLAGTVSFNALQIDRAGTFNLTASVQGQPTFRTDMVTIVVPVGAPSKLKFVVQPSSASNVATVLLLTQPWVVITDNFDNNVTTAQGVGVTLSLTTPNGATLSGTTTLNSVDGLVKFTNLRVDKVGTYTLTATSSPLSAAQSISFTVIPGAPFALAWTGTPAAASVVGLFTPTPVAVVLDSGGNVVPNAGLTLSVSLSGTPANPRLFGTTARNTGVMETRFDDVGVYTPGSYALTAVVTSPAQYTGVTPATFLGLTVSPGPAVKLRLTLAPGGAVAGDPFAIQPTVTVQDEFNNTASTHMPVLAVDVAITSGGGSLTGTHPRSASGGVATFTDLGLTDPGAVTLQFTAASIAPDQWVSASLVVVPAGGPQLAVTVAPAGAVAALPFTTQPRVELHDSSGVIISGANGVLVSVSIASGPSGATLSGQTGRTSNSGAVTFTDLTLDKAGPYTLAVLASGYAPTTMDVTVVAGAVAQLTFTTAAAGATGGTAFVTQPTVALEDSAHNRVLLAGVVVSLTVRGGPASGRVQGANAIATTASGVATFTGLSVNTVGVYTLVASAWSAQGSPLVNATAALVVVLGNPVKITILTAPAGGLGGTPFTTQPVAGVTDAGGNVVTSVPSVLVTWRIQAGPGSGVLRGTASLSTTSGVATFAGLSLTTAGGYTLVAESSGLGSDSVFVAVQVGAASRAVFSVVPTAAYAGGALSPQPTVQCVDAGDNTVTTCAGTVSLSLVEAMMIPLGLHAHAHALALAQEEAPALAPLAAGLTGQSTRAFINGVAAFSGVGLTAGSTAGDYELHATAAGLTTAVQSGFSVTLAPAVSSSSSSGSSQPPTDPPTDAAGFPIVAAAAGAGGGLCLLLILIAALVLCRRRRMKQNMWAFNKRLLFVANEERNGTSDKSSANKTGGTKDSNVGRADMELFHTGGGNDQSREISASGVSAQDVYISKTASQILAEKAAAQAAPSIEVVETDPDNTSSTNSVDRTLLESFPNLTTVEQLDMWFHYVHNLKNRSVMREALNQYLHPMQLGIHHPLLALFCQSDNLQRWIFPLLTREGSASNNMSVSMSAEQSLINLAMVLIVNVHYKQYLEYRPGDSGLPGSGPPSPRGGVSPRGGGGGRAFSFAGEETNPASANLVADMFPLERTLVWLRENKQWVWGEQAISFCRLIFYTFYNKIINSWNPIDPMGSVTWTNMAELPHVLDLFLFLSPSKQLTMQGLENEGKRAVDGNSDKNAPVMGLHIDETGYLDLILVRDVKTMLVKACNSLKSAYTEDKQTQELHRVLQEHAEYFAAIQHFMSDTVSFIDAMEDGTQTHAEVLRLEHSALRARDRLAQLLSERVHYKKPTFPHRNRREAYTMFLSASATLIDEMRKQRKGMNRLARIAQFADQKLRAKDAAAKGKEKGVVDKAQLNKQPSRGPSGPAIPTAGPGGGSNNASLSISHNSSPQPPTPPTVSAAIPNNTTMSASVSVVLHRAPSTPVAGGGSAALKASGASDKSTSSTTLQIIEGKKDQAEELNEREVEQLKAYLVPANMIGSGSYGAVYRAEFRGENVAVKVMSAEGSDSKTRETFLKEVGINTHLRSPRLVHYIRIYRKPPQYIMVMEYMEKGNLRKWLTDSSVAAAGRLEWALQIVRGLRFLHENDPPIAHRDLKPENVLVDRFMECKLCDFGLSTFSQLPSQSNMAGSVLYMAPEILNSVQSDAATAPKLDGNALLNADIYSLGILLIEVFGSKVPWKSYTWIKIMEAHMTKQEREVPADLSPSAVRELLTACLSRDPARRPTIAEAYARLVDLQRKLFPTSPSAGSAPPSPAFSPARSPK